MYWYDINQSACFRMHHRIEEYKLILSSGSEFRHFAFELVESRWFGFAILLVIFANTIFIAIQTSEYVVAKAGGPHSIG